MPDDLGGPGCIGRLGSLYLEGTGLAASSLPSYGPAEGSISDFCEPKSGLAETPHVQPTTPRAYWRGHISGSEISLDMPTEEDGELLVVGTENSWLRGIYPWQLGMSPP